MNPHEPRRLEAARRPPRRETLAWVAVVVLIFLQPVLALVAHGGSRSRWPRCTP